MDLGADVLLQSDVDAGDVGPADKGGQGRTRADNVRTRADNVRTRADRADKDGRDLGADVLLEADEDAGDVGPAPDRLPQRVGEAQGQQVLRHLLAQVVVDPVQLRLCRRPKMVN